MKFRRFVNKSNNINKKIKWGFDMLVISILIFNRLLEDLKYVEFFTQILKIKNKINS